MSGEAVTGFAMRQVAQLAQRSADQLRDRAMLVVDLVVGATTIVHQLGRKPTGATVTPTVANATWAWALTLSTKTQAVITCVGVAQPGATVEVF